MLIKCHYCHPLFPVWIMLTVRGGKITEKSLVPDTTHSEKPLHLIAGFLVEIIVKTSISIFVRKGWAAFILGLILSIGIK